MIHCFFTGGLELKLKNLNNLLISEECWNPESKISKIRKSRDQDMDSKIPKNPNWRISKILGIQGIGIYLTGYLRALRHPKKRKNAKIDLKN